MAKHVEYEKVEYVDYKVQQNSGSNTIVIGKVGHAPATLVLRS